ncbi:MAG: HEPN domain-containing protein [Chitinophagaceae bacterium]|nr:HEPN domain-containing protein [Chitinophagaceae bacterium]MDP1764958.1 HEPN domain-containing protein [Sediminibacterium sp.]MDP1811985.1 HEPN domain-containing protein [Sediminibacterium sp.]MDP3666358.1 HEPN domain-containing protein [Sediminibacterium sp.]
MTIEEHINWWKEDALRAWETAVFNREGGQYVFALFAFHLTIEKLLKAIWIKDNALQYPPRIHDLTILYNQTDLELPNGWYDYLGAINEWNIEGRYPDYKLKIYKRASKEYLEEHSQKLVALKKLLLTNIN